MTMRRDFIDDLLLLIWGAVLVFLALGLVFTVTPGLQAFIAAIVTPEMAFAASAFGFLLLSTARFLINKHEQHQRPWAMTMAASYTFTLFVYGVLVTQNVMYRPTSYLVGAIVPSCALSIISVPARYVWHRIKPTTTGAGAFRRPFPPQLTASKRG
jgi:uncharacterized membrane protein YozB (DUF420 family)